MNKIESYVDSVIPKNIPKFKQQKLRAEIEAHIFDRIDFYTEIGYDTDASIDKAIADMGEDEETKSSIRNNFEELHHERTWWAVAVGILMVLFNWVIGFLLVGYYLDLEPSNDMPVAGIDTPYVYSFAASFLVAAFVTVLYKKGFRKCLMSIGVSNAVSFSAHSLLAAISVSKVLVYLFTKDTSVSLSVAENASLIIFDCLQLTFIFGTVILCFLLANKVKKTGKPKIKYISVIVFAVIHIAIAVVAINNLLSAEQYLFYYPTFFNTERDAIAEQAKEVYCGIDENSDNEQIEKIMFDNNYVMVDEYADTFDKNYAKKYRRNFEEFDFFFSGDYEVWYNPNRDEVKDVHDSNGFVFILRDENGYIKSKGVGNALENVSSCFESPTDTKYADIGECVDTFTSYKVGISKEKVLKYFQENGIIYGEFTTYTETGEDSYYRILCTGIYRLEEDELRLLNEHWFGCEIEPYDEIGDFYFEFWFEDGVLEDGKLHYPEYYYDDELDIVETRYKTYTLAD